MVASTLCRLIIGIYLSGIGLILSKDYMRGLGAISIMTWTIRIFMAVTGIFGVISIYLAIHKSSEMWANLAGAIFTFLAVVVALKQYYDQKTENLDNQKSQSVSNLCASAYNLLSDKNNGRERWLEAAKLLISASELIKTIKSSVVKAAAEADIRNYRLKFRELFYDICKRPGEVGGFFYGLPNYAPDQAIPLATYATDSYKGYQREGYLTRGTMLNNFRKIHPRSLLVVYKFAFFADDSKIDIHTGVSQAEVESISFLEADTLPVSNYLLFDMRHKYNSTKKCMEEI